MFISWIDSINNQHICIVVSKNTGKYDGIRKLQDNVKSLKRNKIYHVNIVKHLMKMKGLKMTYTCFCP